MSLKGWLTSSNGWKYTSVPFDLVVAAEANAKSLINSSGTEVAPVDSMDF